MSMSNCATKCLIDWIILFYLFYFYFPNTLSIDLIMMILNKRIKPEKVMKINEHYKF